MVNLAMDRAVVIVKGEILLAERKSSLLTLHEVRVDSNGAFLSTRFVNLAMDRAVNLQLCERTSLAERRREGEKERKKRLVPSPRGSLVI